VISRVIGVATKLNTGLYLFGRPGTGKTFTVRETLEKFDVPYAYRNARLTPMGLFELIGEHNDQVIVLDDMSYLFEKSESLNILLAALGNQPNGERIIRYKRQHYDAMISFTGGIIALSNMELHKKELQQALESRVNCLSFDPNEEEMEALILKIAEDGYAAYNMTADECVEVAEFTIEESKKYERRLDLRNLLDKAYADYHQHRLKRTPLHWKDLIRSTLSQKAESSRHRSGSRAEQAAEEEVVAAEVRSKYDSAAEQTAEWAKRTGKSQRAYYRRLKAIGNRPR